MRAPGIPIDSAGMGAVRAAQASAATRLNEYSFSKPKLSYTVVTRQEANCRSLEKQAGENRAEQHAQGSVGVIAFERKWLGGFRGPALPAGSGPCKIYLYPII